MIRMLAILMLMYTPVILFIMGFAMLSGKPIELDDAGRLLIVLSGLQVLVLLERIYVDRREP